MHIMNINLRGTLWINWVKGQASPVSHFHFLISFFRVLIEDGGLSSNDFLDLVVVVVVVGGGMFFISSTISLVP